MDDYGQDLRANLENLLERVHSGAYRASPSRRAYISKADGRLRPLGIATLEDKILQRAVVEVLGAIYEEDFLGFSYGFRPGRSPHDALDALTVGIQQKKVNWVLDADVKDFFTSLDHDWLARFVEHRIADKRILRLIQKWVNAGVIEDGEWSASETGAPQGASASPLLANIYLHYVLDRWARQRRRQHAHGDVIIVRFADDFVAGFEHRADAEQFLKDLRERFSKFALELHPDKTRLIEFGRNAAEIVKPGATGNRRPSISWASRTCAERTRSDGSGSGARPSRSGCGPSLPRSKTSSSGADISPSPSRGSGSVQVVRGHLAYYAVPGNIDAVVAFRQEVTRYWFEALRRRSQRTRITWNRMRLYEKRWLPPARTMHPFPSVRFNVRTQGRSPVR